MATTTPGFEPKDADPMTDTVITEIRSTITPMLLADQPLTGAVVLAAVMAGFSVLTGISEDQPEAAAPRDETADSIDPATGTLTQDAVARRAELALELADDRTALEKAQARFDAASAAATADDAELAAAQADLDAAKAEDAKDEAELAALGTDDAQALPSDPAAENSATI